MWLILFFRVFLILIFLLAAWKFGDWKNRARYYPTVLFVITANLGASFLSYHHNLWVYNPDALVKTQTTVEMINSFIMLPAATFIYLSNFPTQKQHPYGYMLLWVFLFSMLEFIDSHIVHGISYDNGWSWFSSSLFDCAIFSVLRLHYLKPFWAWFVTVLLTIFILTLFNFGSAELK
ncbi:Hypothetical protein LUCI_1730 [Lucifera butyrica]|uniref:Uncharacterized protein n=1 Tax=Lucifera butyrica TaxID=1351585 RepID=A0A498R6J5_9FIRM|nr:CBO0543 family protein [Lucifera butyrica]VBB06497.1 Hypothetical protein LUCI_1730 [Lucifera butyrica]